MQWLKRKLQTWLEIAPSHKCKHEWAIIEQKETVELFQMPPERRGHFELPNTDKNTYKLKKTRYILQCKHCGDIRSEVH